MRLRSIQAKGKYGSQSGHIEKAIASWFIKINEIFIVIYIKILIFAKWIGRGHVLPIRG